MEKKRSISSRADIEELVNSFYEKVKKDELLSPIFNYEGVIDWEQHLPVMYDFWETLLLDNYLYRKNAIIPHIKVHKKVPLRKLHFDRWVELFQKSVDELFYGEKAELAKVKAMSISTVIQTKIHWNDNRLSYDQ